MPETSEQTKNYIKARLSLRKPQADSLDLLDKILSEFDDIENIPGDQLLEKVKSVSNEFNQYDFDFPSMCFALATGVGKTRLMGAIIYYLYKVKNIRNFFVVAPNLTIYNKLRTDFSYGSPKYVFRGLSDVDGQNPLIVDGDNYIGVNQALSQGLDLFTNKFTINIFNISKFNSKKENEKMKKFSEYIGESYYEYLQNLKDLVVLMDESHRYRADSSMQAINELKPILGFEFTATPYTMSGTRKVDFGNVLYRYNLANAIQDGFVKTPWVATRENINTAEYDDEALDFLKISDGIAIHERTKVELKVYADNNNKPYVKPFMMISAMDQNHADHLENMLRDFDGGKYRDKIVKIYSGGGADIEENIEELLEIEKPENPIEIVIQVMMLKEGWDVNNLYTIVPLRASASEILTEQTIGRGLRLPYGTRVGDEVVDRLTIVAHDKYQQVVDEANKPDSLVKNVINLDNENNFSVNLESQTSKPRYLDSQDNLTSSEVTKTFVENNTLTQEEAIQINSFINENIVKILEKEKDLENPEIKQRIAETVLNLVETSGDSQTKISFGKLSDEQKQQLTSGRTDEVIQNISTYEIKIPKVIFRRPDPDPRFDTNFHIDPSFLSSFTSPDSAIRLRNLTNADIEKLKVAQHINVKGDIKDYFVKIINEIPEIDYGTYYNWIYEMADILSAKIRELLGEKPDDEYKILVFYYKNKIIEKIKEQILSENCYTITKSPGEAHVDGGFLTLRGHTYSYLAGCTFDFRESNIDKPKIKSYLFTGFSKTSEQYMKFDSDTERVFSVILEMDENVIKWIRPKDFTIDYYFANSRHSYEPDFVVETSDSYYIVETKDASRINTPEVQAKKDFTLEWIKAVNENTEGKEWKYAIIADNDIQETYTFDHVIALQA